MRDINEDLKIHLLSGATTVCRCWLVCRKDGQRLGFTDHDRNLHFDDTDFAASSGLDASALQTSTGLSVDNAQAMGALNSEGITEADIETGKYDGAEVSIWLVNWADAEQRVLQFRGSLGEIRRGSGGFEAELRGLAEALNKPVGRSYMRKCDALLGDSRCRFNLNTPGFSQQAVVDYFSGRRVFYLEGLEEFAPDWFLHGRIEWLSGQNSGATGLIKADGIFQGRRVIEIWEELRFQVEEGDTLRIFAGCDKLANTCSQKFSNLLNFQGFPYMPGEDWAVSYPQRSSENTGGSRA